VGWVFRGGFSNGDPFAWVNNEPRAQRAGRGGEKRSRSTSTPRLVLSLARVLPLARKPHRCWPPSHLPSSDVHRSRYSPSQSPRRHPFTFFSSSVDPLLLRARFAAGVTLPRPAGGRLSLVTLGHCCCRASPRALVCLSLLAATPLCSSTSPPTPSPSHLYVLPLPL
jgi:hypothetical protein